MKPLRIWARNLRTWADLDVQVPAGVSAIVGANGAGKSSLVNVIDLALFGSGRELKRALSRGSAEEECEVGLDFEHRGELYRVRRSYSAKGSGKSRLDFERLLPFTGTLPSSWASLSRETIDATEQELEALLGLSRQTFRASSYLAQGEGDAFTAAPPRERKAILLEALGVRLWDRLRERAAGERAESERALSRLLGLVEGLEGQLALRGASEATAAQAEIDAGRIAFAVTDLEMGTAELREEYAQAQAREATALQAVGRYESARGRLADAERSRAEVASRSASEQDSFGQQGDISVARCHAAEARLTALQEHGATCPTCSQPLAGEALAAAEARLREECLDAEHVRDQALERAQAAARRDGQMLTALDERLPELRSAAEDAKASAEEYATAHAAQDLRARLEAAERQLRERRAALQGAEASLARARGELERLEQVEWVAGHSRIDLQLLQDEVGLLKLAERAYGRDGVPALILEAAALPQLEAEANRIIGELGRGYRFELRSQRATQAGTVQEALDIIVQTEQGEAAYEDFSGGERTRLDLALRIALARLLAARRGADIRLLAIDEPAYLDAEGFERLASVLRGLSQEFESVLVVSHVSELRDAFDQALVVAGGADTGEPSRLEEAA